MYESELYPAIRMDSFLVYLLRIQVTERDCRPSFGINLPQTVTHSCQKIIIIYAFILNTLVFRMSLANRTEYLIMAKINDISKIKSDYHRYRRRIRGKAR